MPPKSQCSVDYTRIYVFEKKFLLLRLIAQTQLRLRVNSDFVYTRIRVHV